MLRRFLNRRLGLTLLWVLAIMLIAVGVNLIGIHIVGSVDDWSQWLESHRWHFFAWRLCVYGATLWGWWCMRERLRQPEPARETQTHLLRTEIAAALAILAIESTALLRSP